MLSSAVTTPSISEMLTGPVIVELNDLNLDEKALIVLLLLTQLREHLESCGQVSSSLRHVCVVEEAHNILRDSAPQSGGENQTKADTRHHAVETFCDLLTEIRAYGEGLIVADQSPAKLARDVIRNSNLTIVHQLRDAADRRTMAGTMLLDKRQEDYLAKLAPGSAALFMGGLEKATFVQTPFDHVPSKNAILLSDDALRRFMEESGHLVGESQERLLPFSACMFCEEPCRHKERVQLVATTAPFKRQAAAWMQSLLKEGSQRRTGGKGAFTELLQGSCRTLEVSTARADRELHWCYFLHTWDWANTELGLVQTSSQLTIEHRRHFEAAYLKQPLNASA